MRFERLVLTGPFSSPLIVRNHYDRIVHLGYRPALELMVGTSPGRSGSVRDLYLAFTVIASWSLSYELLEWVVALTADPAAGTAYLGTQGDDWDGQKDMALAAAGALVAALWEARHIHRRRQAYQGS